MQNMIPSALELFQTYPELAALIAIIMRAGLAYQRGLSWYEYRTLHGLRRIVFPVLDEYVPVVSFVNPKGGRDDPEYHATLGGSIRGVTRRLRRGGGSLHLLSSLKRRPRGYGDTLSGSHVVWTHSNGNQSEAYLFKNADDTVDVYTHYEASVTDPEEHLYGGQVDGDVRGVVGDALMG